MFFPCVYLPSSPKGNACQVTVPEGSDKSVAQNCPLHFKIIRFVTVMGRTNSTLTNAQSLTDVREQGECRESRRDRSTKRC